MTIRLALKHWRVERFQRKNAQHCRAMTLDARVEIVANSCVDTVGQPISMKIGTLMCWRRMSTQIPTCTKHQNALADSVKKSEAEPNAEVVLSLAWLGHDHEL